MEALLLGFILGLAASGLWRHALGSTPNQPRLPPPRR